METKELNYEAFRRKRARAKKQSSQKSYRLCVSLLIPERCNPAFWPLPIRYEFTFKRAAVESVPWLRGPCRTSGEIFGVDAKALTGAHVETAVVFEFKFFPQRDFLETYADYGPFKCRLWAK